MKEAERYHGVTYKYDASGKGVAVFWHKDEIYPDTQEFDVKELIKKYIDEHIAEHQKARGF